MAQDSKANHARIAVRVKPRSSRSKVLGTQAGELVLALRAAPVDGAANEELEALVAGAFGLPKKNVQIARGAASKHKMVELTGLSPEEVAERLRTFEVLP